MPPIDELPAPPNSGPLAPVPAVPTGIADLPPPPTSGELAPVPVTTTPSHISDLPAPPSSGPLAPATTPESNTTPPEWLDPRYIQAVAKRHGVDAEELTRLAPYYGARLEPARLLDVGSNLTRTAREAAGYAGRSILMGIPQEIYKKTVEPPMRHALDEIREVGEKQRGYAGMAEDMLVPGGAISSLGRGVAGRLAGAVATGAIYGVTGSREGEEIGHSLQGAALGAGLGVGGELLTKGLERLGASRAEKALVAEKAEAESRQAQMDLSTGQREVAERTANSEPLLERAIHDPAIVFSPEESSLIVREHLAPESVTELESRGTEAVTEAADQIATDRVTAFAQDLTGVSTTNAEKASKEIGQWAERQGPEATANRYQQFLEAEQTARYIREEGLRALDQPGIVGRGLNMMSDAQYVLRGIDEKYGTTLEPTLREANRSLNRLGFVTREFAQDLQSIWREARSTGVDRTIRSTDHIYTALDTGDRSLLTPAENAIADRFRDYLDRFRGFANETVRARDPGIAPLAIPHLENYVPHILLSTQELIPAVERKAGEVEHVVMRELGIPLVQATPAQISTLAREAGPVQEMMATLGIIGREPVRSGRDISNAVHGLTGSRDGLAQLETSARAVLARTGGEIPSYLLERNLYKLARGYVANTGRHLYLRNAIDRLGYQRQALDRVGATVESRYLGNLITDALGVRAGTGREAMLRARVSLYRRLDQMIDQVGGPETVRGSMLQAVKGVPDLLESLTRQIYPNTLGWFNLRAVIQNASQSITKTAPELGGAYGYEMITRGAAYTAANMRRLKERNRVLGNVPPEMLASGERAIADGIRATAAWDMSARAVDSASKVGMTLYQSMEEFNRALVTGIGEMMSADLARGRLAAIQSLDRFPRAVRREIRSSISAGDTERATEIISGHLNSTTQYNYNKLSMSEFGRTMGPLFSAFTKWPTATLGDIVQELRNKSLSAGVLRVAEKYVAPFIILQTFDYLMGERMGDPNSLSDIKKKLLGSNGLSQAAPIGTLAGIGTGEIFTPPVVDMAMKMFVDPVTKGVKGGDIHTAMDALGRGAGTAAMTFTPAAGAGRLLFDDLVTYSTGYRPEGATPLERAQEGVRRARHTK